MKLIATLMMALVVVSAADATFLRSSQDSDVAMLQRVRKDSFGSNLLDTIQLQLGSGTQENPIQRILDMLSDIKLQIHAEQQDHDDRHAANQEWYGNLIPAQEKEIRELNHDINEANRGIAIKASEIALDTEEVGERERDLAQNEADQQAINEEHNDAIALHGQRLQEHADSIAVVERLQAVLNGSTLIDRASDVGRLVTMLDNLVAGLEESRQDFQDAEDARVLAFEAENAALISEHGVLEQEKAALEGRIVRLEDEKAQLEALLASKTRDLEVATQVHEDTVETWTALQSLYDSESARRVEEQGLVDDLIEFVHAKLATTPEYIQGRITNADEGKELSEGQDLEYGQVGQGDDYAGSKFYTDTSGR